MPISTKRLEELKARNLEEPNFDEIAELGDDFFQNATLIMPSPPKKQLTVRFDAEVVEWFKAQGKGYQTRMNAVLKNYVDAVRKQ